MLSNKGDESYENIVLSQIQTQFSKKITENLQGKMVMKFTDNEGETTCEFVRLESFDKYEDEDKSFWEKRRERQEEINKEIEKNNKKRKIREKIAENRRIDTININEYTRAVATARIIENMTGEKQSIDFTPLMKNNVDLLDMIESLSNADVENIL